MYCRGPSISFSDNFRKIKGLKLRFLPTRAPSAIPIATPCLTQCFRLHSSFSAEFSHSNDLEESTSSITKMTIQPSSSFVTQFFNPTIASILSKKSITSEPIKVQGWVTTCRPQKHNTFLHVSDGSSKETLQVVVNERMTNILTGSSVIIKGQLTTSLPGLEQEYELHTTKEQVEILGDCDSSYPFQKKYHGIEFLRKYQHLRPKTSDFANMLRTRSALMHAIHDYCKKYDIMYIHTPILTSSQCETGGDVFKVEAAHSASSVSSSDSFFGHPSYLTVSSQLHLELFTNAHPRVYTLSPCFRAEPTQSSRHLSEFHMLELEYGFLDSLITLCSLTTDLIQHVVRTCMSNPQLQLIGDRVNLLLQPFQYIEYHDALAYVAKKGVNTQHGLTPEAERIIAEDLNAPTFLVRYPKSERPFYMKEKELGMVENFDLILPYAGEIAGGSLRENNLEVLKKNIVNDGMKLELYDWYLDTRKYGSPEHGGFGLGFDRLILYLLGKDNLKDCIGLPRLSKECDY